MSKTPIVSTNDPSTSVKDDTLTETDSALVDQEIQKT